MSGKRRCDEDPHDVAIRVLIGKRLERRRKLMQMTQARLAYSIGVVHQMINKYETGDCELSATRLKRIADALEVPIGYFFEDTH